MDVINLPEIDLSRCYPRQALSPGNCSADSLACVLGCPTGALSSRDGLPFIAKPDQCSFCSTCESLCPWGAIRCAFEIVWDTSNNSPSLSTPTSE